MQAEMVASEHDVPSISERQMAQTEYRPHN